MICENCGTQKASRVLESRERQKFTYRRRKCSVCGFEYMTHEIFIRGEMPFDGPYVIPYEALKKWREAVWLEMNDGWMTATSVVKYGSRVEFAGGFNGGKWNYNKLWRAWSARPSDRQRKEVEWNVG